MDVDSQDRTLSLDVIIRTLADAPRAEQLERAIQSVHAVSGLNARPIVVANGDRYDPALLESLRSRTDLTFVYMEKPSAGKAMVLGRCHVSAAYFMYLDDDDELISDALGSLLQEECPLSDPPDWQVLITNRLCRYNGELRREYSDLAAAKRAPVAMLLRENWLSAGASIFATDAVDAALIDVGRDNHEWTHMAFRLACRGYKLRFVDVPAAVYNDTEASLSKSQKHQEQELDMLEALAGEPSADDTARALVERKYRNLLHVMSARSLEKGDYRDAWIYHLKSMRPPHTFRYLLYSRKLLFP